MIITLRISTSTLGFGNNVSDAILDLCRVWYTSYLFPDEATPDQLQTVSLSPNISLLRSVYWSYVELRALSFKAPCSDSGFTVNLGPNALKQIQYQGFYETEETQFKCHECGLHPQNIAPIRHIPHLKGVAWSLIFIWGSLIKVLKALTHHKSHNLVFYQRFPLHLADVFFQRDLH